jgi:hypothetical protein
VHSSILKDREALPWGTPSNILVVRGTDLWVPSSSLLEDGVGFL